MWDVDSLKQSVSPEQWAKWRAFMRIEPTVGDRMDYYLPAMTYYMGTAARFEGMTVELPPWKKEKT